MSHTESAAPTAMTEDKMKTPDKSPLEDFAMGTVDMDDKRLLRKVDWHLLPIMFLTYFLQMIDKISINVCHETLIFRGTRSTSLTSLSMQM